MQHYLWKKLKMVACHAVIQSMPILYELKTPHVKYWKLKTCQLVKLSICFSFKSVHYMFFLLNNFVLRVCLFLPKKKKKKRSSTNNFFPAHIFFVLIISIFASGFFKKWRVQRPIYITRSPQLIIFFLHIYSLYL